MSDKKHPLRVLAESGPLIAVAVAIAMLVAVVMPASAQFFPFGFGQRPQQRQQQPYQQQQPFQQRGFGDFFAPFQGDQPQAPRVDYSRAPPPKADKGDAAPERHVLVLGDAMADWLAYGLEDAFSEQPDMGVIRKHRTVSGLIRYQPRGEPSEWAAAAKGIVAQEKADVIVVMLGLHDRTTIREPVAEKPDPKKDDRRKADSKAGAKQETAPNIAKKPEEDAEAPPADDQADSSDTPSIAAPERTQRAANGLNEFRSERWIELYKKKIDDMIGVLKTKGVPVLWVGLPTLRGPKATSDMLFLDSLYRESASKAGITYVDVWDGFVDEAGRFMQQGPDFEGQTRRLRTGDGVFFTKPGARKLAHYVDREIKRLLANRALPVALPSDPGTPDANVGPGVPAPRPLAGPILPLVASSVGTNELLGGSGTRPAAIDALAARTLIKGEPLAAPGGRADDFAWPRREVGRVDAREETPIAGGTPAGATPAAATAAATTDQAKPVKRRPRPAVTNNGETGGSWPSFFPQQQRPVQPVQPQQRPSSPRPPAPVGRAALAPGPAQGPGGFFTR